MENSKQISSSIEEKLKLIREDKGRAIDSIYYSSLIGSMRYLTATRSDIVFGVGLLSRFMDEPRACHLQTAKMVFRYIKGTLNDGIFYKNTNYVKLVGYTDNDWAGDIETSKSTLGYVLFIRSSAIL